MKKLFLIAALVACGVQAQEQTAADYSRTLLPPADGKVHPEWVSVHAKEQWSGGVYKYYYNPSNQPANLSTADVVNALQVAANRWASMCGLTMQYMGLTAMEARNTANQIDPNGLNVIQFKVLTGVESGFIAYTPWLVQHGAMLHADVLLNASYTWSISDLTGAMTHEFGHAIGLEHSEVPESVMYAKPYHNYTYMQTLRGDDANGCAALYGASANQASNRIMNWAESQYPQLLGNSTAPTGFEQGYVYRFYSSTNSYIGTKGERAYYYVPATGSIQDVGAVSDFLPLAAAAGF